MIFTLSTACNNAENNKDLCNPNPCNIPNKNVCSQRNNDIICECNEGFIASGYLCVKENECLENSCGMNENCSVVQNEIVCSCKEKYIEINNFCVFDCSDILNSETNSTNDGCDCISEYIKDETGNCIFDVNQICNPNPCNSHEICTVNGQNHVCICEENYININETCMFDCSDILNGKTNSTNDGCTCISGFHLENGICIENTNECPNEYQEALTLFNNDLKSELFDMVKNHTVLNYDDEAKPQMFGYIDNENGKVRCVYTAEYYDIPVGTMPNQNNFNCEHSWPQSMGAQSEPAKSDLHHLFPTYSKVNSERSNYPFGIPVTQVESFCNTEGTYCSKKGKNSSNQIVFEPADEHKGDVARAMMYFSIRYDMRIDSMQEEVFKQWNILDPVSENEIIRNEKIKALQHNSNPFIDCSKLVDNISDF